MCKPVIRSTWAASRALPFTGSSLCAEATRWLQEIGVAQLEQSRWIPHTPKGWRLYGFMPPRRVNILFQLPQPEQEVDQVFGLQVLSRLQQHLIIAANEEETIEKGCRKRCGLHSSESFLDATFHAQSRLFIFYELINENNPLHCSTWRDNLDSFSYLMQKYISNFMHSFCCVTEWNYIEFNSSVPVEHPAGCGWLDSNSQLMSWIKTLLGVKRGN